MSQTRALGQAENNAPRATAAAVAVRAEAAEVSIYLSQTRTQLRTGSRRSRVATIQSIAEFIALHENMHPRYPMLYQDAWSPRRGLLKDVSTSIAQRDQSIRILRAHRPVKAVSDIEPFQLAARSSLYAIQLGSTAEEISALARDCFNEASSFFL